MIQFEEVLEHVLLKTKLLTRRLRAEVRMFDGIEYDYRATDPISAKSCIPITFFCERGQRPVASTTFIFADEVLAQQLQVLWVNRNQTRNLPIGDLLEPPILVTGYSEILPSIGQSRLTLIKWYISLLKELESLGMGLYTEVTGSADSAVSFYERLGSINPASEPVLSFVRMLDMKRADHCFESNTLGPVYIKERQPKFK